jgi:hypothetical protein
MRAAMKGAAAYLRDGKIFLHPDSRTIKGFWIACEPVLVTSAADKNLGAKLLQMLARSSDGVPDPGSLAKADSWSVTKTLVKAAGTRSYEGFADSAHYVGVRLDDVGVEFAPTRNAGPRERFLYLKKRIRCNPVESEVVASLIEAFEACE